jgi:hypothetical protein
MDWKPLLKTDDDTRLFANTFNMPQELVETAAVRRRGRGGGGGDVEEFWPGQ